MFLIIAVIAALIFFLVIVYTCGQFWLGSSYSPFGPHVSPHIVEETRPSKIISEATYISVWYREEGVVQSPPATKVKVKQQHESDCDEGQSTQATDMTNDNNDSPSPSTSTSSASSASTPASTSAASSLKDKKDHRKRKIDAIQKKQKLGTFKSEDLGCDLVIAVHVSKKNGQIGGYCLDLKNKLCQFYSYDLGRLPWKMNDDKALAAAAAATADTGLEEVQDEPDLDKEYLDECHSKNLIFALLLWEEKLKEFKKFKLYTTNGAIRWPKSKYGGRIRELLTHLEDCENLYKCNTMIVLEEEGDLEKYVRYILPAKQLSKLGIKMFTEFISSAYGVERFDGTHEYVRDETVAGNAARKAMYMSTKYYESFLTKVQTAVTNYRLDGCKKCGWGIRKTRSLQNIVISASKDNTGPPVVPKTGSRGDEEQIVIGKAPPSSTTSLSRKFQKPGFPTLSWSRKSRNLGNSTSFNRNTLSQYSTSKGQGFGDSGSDSCISPRRPSAPPESSDAASTSSKGTTDHSDGYSTSKSTYSSKGTLPIP